MDRVPLCFGSYVVVPFLALALGGCSSDEGAPAATGGAGGAAVGTGGVAATGGTNPGGGSASGGKGGLTGTGGGGAGGDTSCPKFTGATGSVPPPGVTVLAPSTSPSGARVVGIAGGKVYVVDISEDLFSLPAEGGPLTPVRGFPSVPRIAGTDRLVWQEPEPSADGGASRVRLMTAPLANPTSTTVLATGLDDLESLDVDATHAYYSTATPPNLYRVPLAGGSAPELLTSNMNPLGSVIHAGFFYWMDFDSSFLERVPLAGGARERLADVHFGGPMVAEGDAVFWGDTSLNRIEKWTPSGGRQGLSAADPNGIAVMNGVVYWGDGFVQSTLRSINADGGGQKAHLCGLADVSTLVVDGDSLVFSAGRGGILRYRPAAAL